MKNCKRLQAWLAALTLLAATASPSAVSAAVGATMIGQEEPATPAAQYFVYLPFTASATTTVANSTSAAINVINAKGVILVLADDSTNTVSDAATYVYPDATTDEPNAAVFSDVDLTISGGGVLNVTGNYNDGIATKDELLIAGGTITVKAVDDGVRGKDSVVVQGGSLAITAGGTVVMHGPTTSMNGALDYDGIFTMTGGVLAAAGSAGMAQAPSASSTQNSLLINFNTTLLAGMLVHIQDSAGNSLLTLAPAKNYQSLAFSSPQMATGGAYVVYVGGTAAGSATDDVYSGAYTPGQQYTSFTVTSAVTQIGGGGGRP